MADDLKEHVTSRPTWMRLLYMILFIVAFNVAELIIAVILLVQFLFKLFTGNLLDQLVAFGDALSTYIADIVRFLTFRTEDMPYPFAKWPKGAAGNKTATRKTPRKRSAGSAALSRGSSASRGEAAPEGSGA